jgi:hypothetical protein
MSFLADFSRHIAQNQMYIAVHCADYIVIKYFYINSAQKLLTNTEYCDIIQTRKEQKQFTETEAFPMG